jgi:hypothetical protein
MAGQSCPLCARPIEPGQGVAFRQGTLRHLSCADDRARHGRLAAGERAESSPRRCAACDLPVEADRNVVVLPTGDVEHVQCPSPVCSVCTKPVLPDDAARRFRADAFHEACWARRSRAITGGAA